MSVFTEVNHLHCLVTMPLSSNRPKKRQLKQSRGSISPSKSAHIPSIASLNATAQEKVDAWFRAESTQASYKRLVKEAKGFAQHQAGEMEAAELAGGIREWNPRQWASAFDVISKVTPKVLHIFVVYKCEVLENSYRHLGRESSV